MPITPLEIGLLGVLAGWFFFDRRRAFGSPAQVWAALIVALLVLQVLIEGVRWSMALGYLLAAVGLTQALHRAASSAPLPSSTKIIARLGFGFVVLGWILAVALPSVLFPRVSFSRPTGPYLIGSVTYDWVDSTRLEGHTPDPNDYREILVQAWYPVDSGATGGRVPYHPDPDYFASQTVGATPVPAFILSGLAQARTHGLQDVPISKKEATFPVLLFSHGFGGTRVQNTFEVEELASRGYVVFAVEHTYMSSGTVFADGRRAPMASNLAAFSDNGRMDSLAGVWSADARFALDRIARLGAGHPSERFGGRLDLARLGYVGMSFGGPSAIETMANDPRVKAAINMDGFPFGNAWKRGGLPGPLMVFRSDPPDFDKLDEKQLEKVGTNRAQMRQIFADFNTRDDSLLARGGYQVGIHGSAHLNYTDTPLLAPLLAPMIGLGGSADPRRVHRIVNAYTLAFLDRYLRGLPSPLLDAASPDYPEVAFRKY
ncbi:MAG: hypothetical protein ABI647_05165 [Gemmatimonadota bacterium]